MNEEEKFKVKVNRVKDNVEAILKVNEFARNDDSTLVLLYWVKFDNLIYKLDKLKFLCSNNFDLINVKGSFTPASSITRARRLLQYEQCIYLADNKTTQERMIRQDLHKTVMSKF
jgi:hypothetical protein